MKAQQFRLSGAMVVSLIALVWAFPAQASTGVGGQGRSQPTDRRSSAAGEFGPKASQSSRSGKLHVRSGKIIDHDTTLGDGNFNFATGHAECKRGERLVDGGIRNVSSAGLIPGLRWALQESGPVPSKRQWVVTAASDLGGLGRKDFVVIAVCESGR